MSDAEGVQMRTWNTRYGRRLWKPSENAQILRASDIYAAVGPEINAALLLDEHCPEFADLYSTTRPNFNLKDSSAMY